MIELRPFEGLGATSQGRLDTYHHFSFASYHDPARTNWGRLRIWNDDTIAARTGIPPHPHRDMEIVTYVRKGAITHRDSLGNAGRTVAGDVQVMSAGTGIEHAEYNLEAEEAEIFQIGILPDRRGGTPQWGTRRFRRGEQEGRFVVLASGREVCGGEGGAGAVSGALPIRADARVLGAKVRAGNTVRYEASPERHAYLVSARGRVQVTESDTSRTVQASPRDGVAMTGLSSVAVTALEDAEIVLVDAA